jgi:hypothetical protein
VLFLAAGEGARLEVDQADAEEVRYLFQSHGLQARLRGQLPALHPLLVPRMRCLPHAGVLRGALQWAQGAL